MHAGNQSFQKQANLALVLRKIRQKQLISRVELARKIGLKKSTVTNIINELMSIGIVKQQKEGKAGITGGRKPVYLSLVADAGCVLGLEIEVGFFRAVITDISGNILANMNREITSLRFPEIFFDILAMMKNQLSKIGLPLIGIGVGIPGSVDLEKGVILNSIAHHMTNFDYANRICAQTPVPVFFENDTNCGAWGELWGQNNPTYSFIYLLTRFHFHNLQERARPGVGIGLVINGNLYYGSTYCAGELGTNIWHQEGTEYLGMDSDEIRKITSDETLMVRFLGQMFQKISVTLSLLDPAQVVLGGDTQQYQHLLPQVLHGLQGDSWFDRNELLSRLRFSSSGEQAIAFGAAALVLERLYRIPRLGEKAPKVDICWADVFSSIQNSSTGPATSTGLLPKIAIYTA